MVASGLSGGLITNERLIRCILSLFLQKSQGPNYAKVVVGGRPE